MNSRFYFKSVLSYRHAFTILLYAENLNPAHYIKYFFRYCQPGQCSFLLSLKTAFPGLSAGMQLRLNGRHLPHLPLMLRLQGALTAHQTYSFYKATKAA
jgi:hypothetical protein